MALHASWTCMVQGMFIKRHQIPNASRIGAVFRPEDLVVGGEVLVYGRKITIDAVDGFTRAHLQQLGIPLAPDQASPSNHLITKHQPGHLHVLATGLLHTWCRTAKYPVPPALVGPRSGKCYGVQAIPSGGVRCQAAQGQASKP